MTDAQQGQINQDVIPFVCGGLCGFAAEKEVGLGIPRRVLPEAEKQGG